MTLSYIVLLVLAALATAKPPLPKNPKPDGNVNANGPSPACGESPLSPPSVTSTYIVDGTTASRGDIPWQVGVYNREGGGFCGGSYVLTDTKEVKVITAANCIESGDDPSSYSVYFGMHDSPQGHHDGVEFIPSSIVRHPTYGHPNTASNDVAIVSFGGLNYTSLLIYTTYASPICLVSTTYTADEIAMVSGWGTTSKGGQHLQYAFVRMVDYALCKGKYSRETPLDTTMLCAAEKGKYVYQGDYGGPLAVYRNDKWQLAG